MKDEHFTFGHLENLDSWPLVLIQALYLDSSNYSGGNCPGWQLSGVAIVRCGNCPGWQLSWVAIVLGGNCPGGNCPGGNYPGGNCPGWQLSGWQLSCVAIILCGNCPVAIIGWQSSGWQLSGGNCPVIVKPTKTAIRLKTFLWKALHCNTYI